MISFRRATCSLSSRISNKSGNRHWWETQMKTTSSPRVWSTSASPCMIAARQSLHKIISWLNQMILMKETSDRSVKQGLVKNLKKNSNNRILSHLMMLSQEVALLLQIRCKIELRTQGRIKRLTFSQPRSIWFNRTTPRSKRKAGHHLWLQACHRLAQYPNFLTSRHLLIRLNQDNWTYICSIWITSTPRNPRTTIHQPFQCEISGREAACLT